MPGIAITAGGRAVAALPVPPKPDCTILLWHDALMRLVREAVANKAQYETIKRMDRWLGENEWHELAAERSTRRDELKREQSAIENRLFERSAHVAQLQEGLSGLSRQGIEALFRCELAPHIAQVWAIEARRIGSTDLFEIVEASKASMLDWLAMEGTL